MMNISTVKKKYRSIKEGAPEWLFRSGTFYLVPRAHIVLEPGCPDHVKQTLYWAQREGYVKLVANIPEAEFTWERLSQ